MDALSRAALERELAARAVTAAPHVHEETGSTNDDAKALARQGAPAGTLVVAEAQTAGRGRQGNVWHSPPRANLYASLILRPRVDPSLAPRFALVTGVVIARACARHSLMPLLVKWPNDVVMGGEISGPLKKVAGILVETQIRGSELGALIVGFGINVRAVELPPALAPIAISLEALGAKNPAREELAVTITADLVQASDRFATEGLAPWRGALRARDALLGRALSVGDIRGDAEGIDEDGALLVRTESGLERVIAGHVELRDVGRTLPWHGDDR